MQYNSIIVYAESICLFVFAVQLKLNLNEKAELAVAKISSLSFGVYLLHEHSFVQEILWKKIVHLEIATENTFIFMEAVLMAVLLIFICGISVEWIRKFFLKEFCHIYNKFYAIIKRI